MKPNMRLATLFILGALPLAGFAADSGGMGSSSSQSGSTSGSSAQSDTSGQTGQVPADFRRLDRNKDGMISRTEAARDKNLTSRFDEIDSDHDGRISLSEWQAANQNRGAAGVSGESREQRSPGMGGSSTGGSSMGGSGTGGSNMGGSSSGSSSGSGATSNPPGNTNSSGSGSTRQY